nr:Flp family type IVb pilin [Desulfofalx alkaliphila]
MSKFKEQLKELHQDESGQGMAEYGLIIALVAVVVIGALTLLGNKLSAKFGEVNDALD